MNFNRDKAVSVFRDAAAGDIGRPLYTQGGLLRAVLPNLVADFGDLCLFETNRYHVLVGLRGAGSRHRVVWAVEVRGEMLTDEEP